MTTPVAAADPLADVHWTVAAHLGVRGLAWPHEPRAQPFDRFPAALQAQVPDALWNLSTQSAGLYVEFRTKARDLFARWTVEPVGAHQRDPYMTKTGQGGVDLYGRDGHGGWQWAGSHEPWGEPACHCKINRAELDGVERTYRLYLPLMRRVLSFEVGARAPLAALPADARRPIVYYGTSIVHGAGVSRPGLGHAQQIGRALDREIINLGFCGRAWCEPAVAEWLGRQPAALYIVDPLPNNSPEALAERLPIFINSLRAADPVTPILLVGERLFGDAAFIPQRGESCQAKNRVLEQVVQDARGAGMGGLHVTLSPNWYGIEGDGSTDANHPNDLGAARLAQALLPVIRPLL